MKPKPKIWNFKADERFINRLNKAAEVLDIPASQIAREAINEKLEALAGQKPELREALEKVA